MEHTKNEWKRYNYLSSEISALYHEAAVKLGLSDSAMNILYAVCENEGRCPQSEVCRLTGVSRQTINSAIRKLEREGVIVLEPGAGRNTVICLTAAGEHVVAEKIRPIIEAENAIFALWSEEERREYLRLTQQYRDELKKQLNDLS